MCAVPGIRSRSDHNDDHMKREISRIANRFKIAAAQQRFQPNMDASTSLLLDLDALPGSGWSLLGQRAFPAHAYKSGTPVMDHAKQIKSTTSRRLFENESTSTSVIVEVTPLANAVDAQLWVSTAEERLRHNLEKVVEVKEFVVIDDVSLPSIGVTACFQTKIIVPKGLQTSLTISANVYDVYAMIQCGSFEVPWTMQEFLEIAGDQVNKIASFRRGAGQ
jgi:hypothetical protein